MATQEVASSRVLTDTEWSLWELQRREPNCGAWNQATAVHVVGGQVTVPVLTAALNLVVRRHSALRTMYPAPDGDPVAVIVPPQEVALDIPVRGPGHGLWPDELRAAAGRPFDLAREAPVRVTVLRFRGVDTLVLSVHRLVGDPWTAGLILEELAAGYGALSAGAPVPPALAGTAEGHAGSPSSPSVARYWRDRLAGYDPAAALLAVGHVDPPEPTFTGALLAQPLGPPAHDAVPALARQLGVTEEVVLLAAYFALLAYHGGGPDLVVGLLDEPAGEPTGISYRAGMLPIRVHVDLSAPIAGLAARVRDVVQAAARHRPPPPDVGPPAVVARSGASPPFMRHTFRSTRQPSYGWLGELPIRSTPADTGHSWYDIAVEVILEPGRTDVRVAYRSEMFDDDDVRAMAQRYDTLLCQAAAAPRSALAELNCWTSADHALVAGMRRSGTGAVVEDPSGRPLPPGVRGQLRQHGAGAGASAMWCYDGRLKVLSAAHRTEAARRGP